MHLNYEELVTNYNKNLDENLRGFTGGPGFLETWAYDTDPARSITEIIDLAIEDDQEVLAIEVSPEIGGSFGCGRYKDGMVISNGHCIRYYSTRASRIGTEVSAAAKSLGFGQHVTTVGLKRNVLTVDYEDREGEKPLHVALIRIENILRSKLRERIEIQTLNLDDKNKRVCGRN